ncbi:hypothetical protein SAY86_019736 [Trapa natans]|uniref:Endoglucanase n=1 Tax=Trapa natans TaxID=22666 RepID=A0AAN7R3I7_TRANT|nr:hypothetical protein SAY86_019736 [Trapa natans]
MAFTTTVLAWSVLEFGGFMGGPDRDHALDAIRWGTDYLLKATSRPGIVYVQVGDPYRDHGCWERPEDMDTPRTSYAVNASSPGSEVAAEIAAALASSSRAFRMVDPAYSKTLLSRAEQVFEFADKHRGSYNDSLGHWVCPFYCDFSGYTDELIWAAAWLFVATKRPYYWSYVVHNVEKNHMALNANFGEFGWDSKHAGINILVSKYVMKGGIDSNPFLPDADRFICSILPESPTKSVKYSPGGLLFKPGGSNMQHAASLSYLLLVYARHLKEANRTVRCGKVVASADRLIQVARSQADYILGSNPSGMSYMVGYGNKFPQRIHHRGSSLPSVIKHPKRIECKEGSPYFLTKSPNRNVLVGAIVGGPLNVQDHYDDNRTEFRQSEPTTYMNAPFVGVLAFFKGDPNLSRT